MSKGLKIMSRSDQSRYVPFCTVPVQSVHMTTKVVSSDHVHGEVYSIQRYVIKFVSDLRQVGGFLSVLWFPSPKKLTTMM
jgi:hypothetical protein